MHNVLCYNDSHDSIGIVAYAYYYLPSTCGWYTNMKAGIIYQRGALWLGVHYSPNEKRYCINIIPCLTIWIATAEGRGPKAPSMLTWKF